MEDGGSTAPPNPRPDEGDRTSGGARRADLVGARNLGIGCFTTFIGFWSGGMVAVLIGRLVENVRGSAACEGLPVCNWFVYAGVGAILGAVSLPVLVLRRLRRRDAAPRSMTRG